MNNGKWRWRAAGVAVAAATALAGGLALAGSAGASTPSCQSAYPTSGAGTGLPSGCGTEQEGTLSPRANSLSFDVYHQSKAAFTPVIAWPNTNTDPATDFFAYTIGGETEYEYAPAGVASGMCVTVSGANYGLALRPCGWWTWQRFWHYSPQTKASPWSLANVQVRGDVVRQNNTKGAQFALVHDPSGAGNEVFNYGP